MNLMDFAGELKLEESSALEVEVAIAAYHDIETFPVLPDLTAGTSNVDYVDLKEKVFVMKPGKRFHTWEGSLEKNSFSSTLVGARGAKSFENTLTIVKNAVNSHLFGWLRSNRNRPIVVAFKFLGESQYCIMGWNKLWAEVNEATIEVPGEVAGEKATTIQIRSIFYPPIFINEIPLTEAEPAP